MGTTIESYERTWQPVRKMVTLYEVLPGDILRQRDALKELTAEQWDEVRVWR